MSEKIKPVIPVEIKGISYMPDNRINIDIIGGTQVFQISPNDALDIFHTLLQAIGANPTLADNLFYAIDDVLEIPCQEAQDDVDAAITAFSVDALQEVG